MNCKVFKHQDVTSITSKINMFMSSNYLSKTKVDITTRFTNIYAKKTPNKNIILRG